MEYQLGECKSCDALADQIAELTKTNLAQAAQIEMLTTAAINVVGPFIHAEQGSPIQILRKALAIPTDSKQILQEWLDKALGEPVVYYHYEGKWGENSYTKGQVQYRDSKPLFKKPEIK